MSNVNTTPEIIEMFNGTAKSNCLDGIMGKETENKKEIMNIERFLLGMDFISKGSILDAGVGVGRLIPVWKEAGFKEITGVDFSPEMIKKCTELYPDIPLYCADLEKTEYNDNRFDVCFLMYVLIHIVDDEKLARVIAELERITKNEIVIGQVMDTEKEGMHSGWCKVRQMYKIVTLFKKKKIYKYYKDFYSIDGDGWKNKISFIVMR